MPYRKEGQLTNWNINYRINAALERHCENGEMSGYDRVYCGDTRRLVDVVKKFGKSADEDDVASTRLRARLSCIDGESRKWHVVSLYQIERLKNGEKKQVLQMTWCARKRTPFRKVVAEINEAFAELIETNPKYDQAAVEVVGKLSKG